MRSCDRDEERVYTKGKVYLLSRQDREEVHEFIQEQLRNILDPQNYLKQHWCFL